MQKNKWYVYMMQCADDSLYTGITTDPDRRTKEHNTSKRGAIYTRRKRPVKLVYLETATDRSSASKREYAIKKLTRANKLLLIQQYKNTQHE